MNEISCSRARLLATTILANVLAMSGALAQVAEAPPIEELVVTAKPYGQQRFDVLTGTSVLTGDRLERNLAPTIGETLAAEPGLSATYFGPGASRPIVRGLGGERTRVLIGGIGSIDVSTTSPDHAVALEPLMVERIEVIRGAGTLLYGSTAVGGVVNVLDGRVPTDLPEDGFDGAVRLGYGTNADDFSGGAAFTASAGPLAIHGEGFIRRTDDIKIPGFARTELLRLAEPLDEEEPQGRVVPTDIESEGGSGGVSYIWDGGFFGASVNVLRNNYGSPISEEEEEEEGAGVAAASPLGAGEEEIRIDIEQERVDVMGDFTGEWGPFRLTKIRFGWADYKQVELEGDEVGTTFLNEGAEGRLELVQKPIGNLVGAVGLQVFTRDFSAIGAEAFVPPNETFRIGVFAVEEFEIGPWHMEIGGRWEHQDVESRVIGIDRGFDTFSAALGTAYHPDDEWLIGMQLSRSARAPNAEELFSNGPHLATNAFELGDPDLDTEKAVSAELSFKKRTGRLTGSLNIFLNDFDGFIFERETGVEEDGLPVFQFFQEDAKFYGLEIEVDYLVYEGDSYQVYADGLLELVRAETSRDEALPRIPPLSILSGLDVTSEMIDGRVEFEWVTKQDRIAAFETPTDSYVMINANLAVRPFETRPELTLRLVARNLNNTTARRHTSFLKDLVPLPGRDFRMQLSYAW